MVLRLLQASGHLSGLGLVSGEFPLLVCLVWTLAVSQLEGVEEQCSPVQQGWVIW